MKPERKHIQSFQPQRDELNNASDEELSSFYTGAGYDNFDAYLKDKGSFSAKADQTSGKGVTHLIWDMSREPRQLVAYFTLSTAVIPFDDGNIDEEEASCLENYPYITAAEIKMFAVAEQYQDLFYQAEDEDLPVSAWCLRYIIQYISYISTDVMGIQAIFLHAVTEAEEFYLKNSFRFADEQMRPLYSIDGDYRAMWIPLHSIPEYKKE